MARGQSPINSHTTMNTRLFGPLRVERTSEELTIGNRLYECVFRSGTAGFPTAIGFTGETPLATMRAPLLTAELAGSRAIRPWLARIAPVVVRDRDAVRVSFENIPWRAEDGTAVDGFRTALEYEFFPDGTVFVRTFFCTGTTRPPALHAFTLAPRLRIPRDQEANWACWTLPRQADAKIIQDQSAFERNIARGANRTFDGAIAPFFSFDMGADGRRDNHIEFFVESWNALAGEPDNTRTTMEWRGREAAVSWNFQRAPVLAPGRAYQWRNTWGWCLRRFPVDRVRAPQRAFHYIDNFKRYPDATTVRQVAATGANTLILHESWRLDMPNGEFAHDRASLQRTLRACRRHGLRVGLYVRGNENQIRERLAEPLRALLRRNRDGLYMDYGSPMTYLGKEEEAPGGRIHFREYHRMARAMRAFVGPDGFFISHSGSFFAACAHTEVDAFVGGEQEKGQLLNDTTLHSYFSGLSVVPGSLWTAAFPTYRTPRMLPYLAASFQTPFLHLGSQFETCSLAHTHVPSLITFARPLWRLWEILDGQSPLRAYCTQGGPQWLKTDSRATGASLLVTRRGEALLIVANYRAGARHASVTVDWDALGCALPQAGFALAASADATGVAAVAPGPTLHAAALAGYGIAGWLLVHDAGEWRRPLDRFLRPYASAPRAEKAWSRHIEEIRRRRFEPPAWRQCYLRVEIPNYANTYEDSIWFDLFENAIELLERTGRGERSLGFVSRRGLVAKVPPREDYLRPGEPAPWIALHNCLGTGRHHLVFATRRQGGEFYSFVKATLSPAPRVRADAYEVVYTNELDLDWSRLAFDVENRG